MSFVIFDTEYTSWKGCQEHGWHGNQKKEIVQIAALKVSDDLEVLTEFNRLCQPYFNPTLSDYFVNLTHITNENIQKEGVSFAKAFADFKEFVGQDICFSHGWGTDYYHKSDGAILDENLALYQISEPNDLVYYNVAAVFKELYQKNNIDIKSQASGDIVSLLGIEGELSNLHLKPHDALYDVYSILAGLRHFRKEALSLLKSKGAILPSGK